MNELSPTEIVEPRSLDQHRAESMVLVETAKMYPRNVTKSIDNAIALATRTIETAAACTYILPPRRKKGGGFSEPITGPSIRCCELVAGQWQNLQTAARLVDIDRVNKTVTVEAMCWDLENNVKNGAEATRPYYVQSDDMIKTAIHAAQSVAVRNAIKRTLGPFIEEVQAAARDFAEKNDKVEEARVKMMDYFTGQGATEEQVLKFAEVDAINELGPQHISKLRGLATAIREGIITIERAFSGHEDVPSDDKGGGSVNLKDLKPAEPQSDSRKKEEEEAEKKKAAKKKKAEPKPTADGVDLPGLLEHVKKLGSDEKQLLALVQEVNPMVGALEDMDKDTYDEVIKLLNDSK